MNRYNNSNLKNVDVERRICVRRIIKWISEDSSGLWRITI